MNYQELVGRWKSLPHKTRKNVRLAVVVGSIGAVAALVVHGARNTMNPNGGVKDNTSSTVLLAPAANLNTQNLAATVDALSREVAIMHRNMAVTNGVSEQQIEAYLRAHPIKPGETPSDTTPADNAQIKALQAQLTALQAQVQARPPVAMPQMPQAIPGPTVISPVQQAPTGQAPGIFEIGSGSISQASAGNRNASQSPTDSTGASTTGIPSAPKPPGSAEGTSTSGGMLNGSGPGGLPGRQRMANDLTHPKTGETEATKPSVVNVSSENQIYLPAGTILTGVTLNGVNVGTGPTAESNPQIVEMRVKKTAILPNGYRVNLTNCMIINTGFGNLAAQRVYLRPTTLSCVDDQGRVVEAAIKGTVVGADGIAGVSGVVVDHQGPLIAKGFVAGLFSGLGGAFSPTAVTPLQVNPGSTTQYQYPSGAQIAGSAVSGGVNNAGSMLAKLYIDEAKALQPTLQINPGITADIILEKGSYVKKKGMTHAELQKTNYEASLGGPATAAPTPQQQAQSQAQAAIAGAAPAPAATPAAAE